MSITLLTTFGEDSIGSPNIDRAIETWTRQEAICDIILYGVSDKSGHYSHYQKVKCIDASGLPKINEMIDWLNFHSSTELVALINSDILIFGDMNQIISNVEQKLLSEPFLITAWRRNVAFDLCKDLTQDYISDEAKVKTVSGIDHGGMDLFIFRKGQFSNFPKLWVGKGLWDFEFIRQSKHQEYSILDATDAIRLYHLDHEPYSNNEDYHKRYQSKLWKDNLRVSGHFLIGLYTLNRADYKINAYNQIISNSPIYKYLGGVPSFLLGIAYHLLMLGYPYTTGLMHLGGKILRIWKRKINS